MTAQACGAYSKTYNTINQQWNVPVAAERFVSICAALLENRTLPVYTSGSMSKA